MTRAPKEKPSQILEIVESPAEGELVEAPVPLARLRATIYETPRGGVHIAFRMEGADSDAHVVFNAAIVKLLGKVAGAGGNPIELLRKMGGER